MLQGAFHRLGGGRSIAVADAMVAMRDGAMVAGYLGDARAARAGLEHGVAALMAAA